MGWVYPSRSETATTGRTKQVIVWLTAIVIAATLAVLAGSHISQDQSTISKGDVGSLSAVGTAPSVPHRLYVLSEVPRPGGSSGTMAGHVTVMDLKTQRVVNTINTGVDVDALPSADGTRLFVASADATTDPVTPPDYLSALIPTDGTQLWRVQIHNRVKYISGGPSTLTLSPNGQSLYVYSYSPEVHAGHVQYWFQIVDTATGKLVPTTIRVPDCGAANFRVTSFGDLAIVCYASNDVRFMNVKTGEVTQVLKIPNAPAVLGKAGGAVASAYSSDGDSIFVLTDDFHVARIDVQRRAIGQWVDLHVSGKRSIGTGMLALSADGTRLIVADNLTDASGTDQPGDVHVFDTGTWREVSRIRPTRMLGPLTPSATADGQSVYAVGFGEHGKPRPDADAVIALSLSSGQAQVPLTRNGEEILAAFIGP